MCEYSERHTDLTNRGLLHNVVHQPSFSAIIRWRKESDDKTDQRKWFDKHRSKFLHIMFY